LEETLLVPEAKSAFSMRATRNPRSAASRATPAPVIPPPRIRRSKVSALSASTVLFMKPHYEITVRNPQHDQPDAL
jgi:hypothetical protein